MHLPADDFLIFPGSICEVQRNRSAAHDYRPDCIYSLSESG